MSKEKSKPMLINNAEITDKCLETIDYWQNGVNGNSVLQGYIDDLTSTQDFLTRMLIDEFDQDSHPQFKFKNLIITLIDLKAELMTFRKGVAS